MDWDWKEYFRSWASCMVAIVLAAACIGGIVYHSGVKQQIAAQNQRNVNRCQAVIIVTDRVCDTVDGIFAPKEAAGEDAEK